MRRSRSAKRGSDRSESLQLCIFCLGLLQDGNVGIGVFPECEEVLISHASVRDVALQRIRACEVEMRQCTDGFIQHNTTMVEDLLKLYRGFAAPIRGQISFAAHI